MGELGQTTETILRLSAFIGIFVVMALIELAAPRRELHHSKPRRWLTNLTISGLNALVVRLMATLAVPIAAVAAAEWARIAGWGAFNLLGWPFWLEILIAIIVLDLAIYGQHVLFHKVPVLWRLHQVHHADVDFDVSTALRFHPVEIALSMLIKIAVVLALGAPAIAVVLFEIILNGCAMFNHANINLPRWLDRALRRVLVTPDMHRVHHSVIPRETDSNFGFNLSIWDRVFRTYRPQPEAGHTGMMIGLNEYQSEAPTRFAWSLALPFRRKRRGAQREPERSPLTPSRD
jgi:sterol desaturase/sphingolipid hydroxylase (fatty acid hydroxylase superfamily)